MKGIILAGGTGSRLHPCTKVTNKHLLPVYDNPMIFFPLQTLKKAGITKIMIVTGIESAGDFMKLLGSGKDFGCDFTYKIQDEAGGIAQALGLAEEFIGKEKFVVILGDNIIEDDISEAVNNFEKSSDEAMIFLKRVDDANRFGVAELSGDRIVRIDEKPKEPKSSYAVTGIYMYNQSVFSVIKTLKPSGRGELEITDVNNSYIRRGTLKWTEFKGSWSDAGTFPSLHRASEIVKRMRSN